MSEQMTSAVMSNNQSGLKTEISYHVYKDYATELTVNEDENADRLFEQNPELRKLRYSMTAFCDRVVDDTLYIGCTNHAGDLLLAMDLKTREIRSCGYDRIYEPNEHKIHKGLWYDPAQHALVFSTSTLSNVDKLAFGEAGKLVRYNIASQELDVIGRNEKGQHAQATVLDAQRKLLHVFSYRMQKFGVFDLASNQWKQNIFVDSIPHISALDDDGRCWSTYEHQNKWCCFDPRKDRFVFYDKALATAVKAADIMYKGAGPVDSMVNGGDGFLYVGTALAELYRLDPATAESEYLGRFAPSKRLPALVLGAEGWIYSIGGDDNKTFVGRYHPQGNLFERICEIVAPDGKRCFRAHDLLIHGHSIFVAETDNRTRSGYIWEISVKD